MTSFLSITGIDIDPATKNCVHPLSSHRYMTGFTTLVSGVTYMASLEGFKVLKGGHDSSSKREPP